jgi:hypothetical protein
MKRLLKFSYAPKDHKVLVKWEQDTPDHRVETLTVESAEEPAPRLVAALEAMAPHVRALCELPPESPASPHHITVRGVTITHGESTGLTITALRALENLMTPLVLNTPHTTEFGQKCGDALEALEAAALGYADGERAQLALDIAGAAR